MHKSPLWLALAWREIKNSKVFSVVFAVSLSLGLTGFLTLDAFRSSLTAHLDERSRSMLGADLVLFGEHELTVAETDAVRQVLPPASRLRQETMMLSMVAHGGRSRLVEVKAVDAQFPFYGTVGLRQAGEVGSSAAAALVQQPIAWVYPEILSQLGAKIGDTVRLGPFDFTVADVIDRDPTVAAAGLEIAPRVVIGAAFLPETKLIQKGSRIFHSTLVALPPGSPDADQVVKTARAAVKGLEVRVRSHRASSEELYRALLHLSDFLGLVALVALFLAGIGGAYLFRAFLERRVKDVVILLSLGVAARTARLVYVTQLILLGVAATALTTLLSLVVLPLVPAALGDLMPKDLAPSLGLKSCVTALAMGTLGSLLACLPLLARLGAVPPQTLFQEAASPRLAFSAKHAAWWVPAVAAFWGLAVVTARSLKTGSLFAAIFLAAAALCAGGALVLMRAAARVPWRGTPLSAALAAASLARHRAATLASFLALGLGALLVNLVPQIRAVLQSELARPSGEAPPSLFLFDIQDDQVAALTAKLSALAAPPLNVSPMIRARLTEIDGQPASQPKQDGGPGGRDDDDGQRPSNRGYNLSYRPGFSAAETLVDGQPFSGKPAEISLEQRFADRMGLGLGMRLTFDVQGVPISGVVVNTRRVRWTSFQPNFFVEFSPGVLEDAPKTFVAGVPALAAGTKLKVQEALVTSFPNVSVVDVGATIQRLLGIVLQMERALVLMAGLALVAGLAVLFAIARYQALRRLPDVTLLKVLGASFSRLLMASALEFAVLGAAAGALGAVLGMAAALILSEVLFDRAWTFSWETPVVAALALTALTTAIGLAAVAQSLGESPLSILQGPRNA